MLVKHIYARHAKIFSIPKEGVVCPMDVPFDYCSDTSDEDADISESDTDGGDDNIICRTRKISKRDTYSQKMFLKVRGIYAAGKRDPNLEHVEDDYSIFLLDTGAQTTVVNDEK